MRWNTKITKVEPNHLVTRGYRQEDLIGNIPYSHVVYLLLKGELPSIEHGKMIDAILTACIDHGVTPPPRPLDVACWHVERTADQFRRLRAHHPRPGRNRST